jgi:Fe-Mn family superoxide dismutase
MFTEVTNIPVYPFEVKPLRYGYDGLTPYIDAEVLRVHHQVHHQIYVNELNKLIRDEPTLHGRSIEDILRHIEQVPQSLREGILNQGGGHANHQFFWKILGRNEGSYPSGALAAAINDHFGSLDGFKASFRTTAIAHSGPGWVFLVADPAQNNKLKIVALPNQDSVLSLGMAGILCCDLWEHAYGAQYQNDKSKWLDAFWQVLAWDVATRRFDGILLGASHL